MGHPINKTTRNMLLASVGGAAMLAAGAAKADRISDLQDQINALRAQIKTINVESAPASNSNSDLGLLGDAVNGRPVHLVKNSDTDITLYGLLEATVISGTNTTKDSKTSTGMNVAWFSGNKWGLYGQQLLNPQDKLKIIARLESEYELPSGDMDTGNVLFNRDAWLGFESDTLGKLTFGRQNTLARDFTNIWGDPYTSATLSTGEGGYTNNNHFKQLIFYSGGGYGANGAGDTRLDNGIVWKKEFQSGLVLGAAYAFSDGNGPGGPNGSGPVPGAGLDKGSVRSVAGGYNGKDFSVSTFYNQTSIFNYSTGNVQDTALASSYGLGGDYRIGMFRLNAGYIHYTADQYALGTRNDKAYTASVKVTPSHWYDIELGWQTMNANNAAIGANGYTLRAYQDTSGAVTTGSGDRGTTYGSLIFHPKSNVDIYLAGDYMKTTGGTVNAQGVYVGGYNDSANHGHDNSSELATGVRWKF